MSRTYIIEAKQTRHQSRPGQGKDNWPGGRLRLRSSGRSPAFQEQDARLKEQDARKLAEQQRRIAEGLLFERRINFKLGIVYETPREKIERVPGIVEAIIRALPGARFDRAHFQSFGDFSLNFEIVYYVEDAAYVAYMDIQQAINLAIHEEFEKAGIEFAYPTVVQYNAELRTS